MRRRRAGAEVIVHDHRWAKRFRRRMTCDLHYGGRTQRAIVVDVSRTGLFVQSGARLSPGTPVEIDLQLVPDRPRIRIRATVARQKAVPHQFTAVAQGGIGLRIAEAPPAYYAMLAADAAPSVPGAPARPRFRVHVKQTQGSRSRLVEIEADDAEDARARAVASMGGGWEALAIEAV
jgi:hypothetical protein